MAFRFFAAFRAALGGPLASRISEPGALQCALDCLVVAAAAGVSGARKASPAGGREREGERGRERGRAAAEELRRVMGLLSAAMDPIDWAAHEGPLAAMAAEVHAGLSRMAGALGGAVEGSRPKQAVQRGTSTMGPCAAPPRFTYLPFSGELLCSAIACVLSPRRSGCLGAARASTRCSACELDPGTPCVPAPRMSRIRVLCVSSTACIVHTRSYPPRSPHTRQGSSAGAWCKGRGRAGEHQGRGGARAVQRGRGELFRRPATHQGAEEGGGWGGQEGAGGRGREGGMGRREARAGGKRHAEVRRTGELI